MFNTGLPALVATIAAALASVKIACQILPSRPKRTDLKGPPSNGFLIGRSLDIFKLTPNHGTIFEEWAQDYGPVYRVPLILGSSTVVICDIKALVYLFTKDTDTYALSPIKRRIHKAMFGHFTLSPDGEEHKKWRRKLVPSFSPTAIRGATSVFYDTAYKLKTHWDAYFESATEVTIDVQNWMSRMTLDALGVAAFGHDLKALEGSPSSVMKVLEEFNRQEDDFLSRLTVFIGAIFPVFLKFPTNRAKLYAKYRNAVSTIAEKIILNERKKRNLSSPGFDVIETSLLDMIVKEKSAGKEIEFGLEDMIGHNVFIVAGYESTSISLTWALIELARRPNMQQKLREELQKFSDCDPTLNQLKTELSYLDAVVHETLRLHPPVELTMRTTTKDDTLPLSNPIQITSGEVVDSVMIQKGTMIILPQLFFNTSQELWGPDAKQFIPDRWLRELTYPAKDIHGYRHLYTFIDGPRMCLGKDFAVAEFKATLSVLIRNFTFELEDGPDTVFDYHGALLSRPKPVGKVGAVTPMRVRQVARD